MKFKKLAVKSLRYAASDWYNLIILGVILFLVENLNSLPGNQPGIDIYDVTFWAIIAFLGFLESGYLFRIVEETLSGSKKPPKFNRLHELILHGIKKVSVFIIYFSVPLFILGLVAFDLKHYLKTLYMNSSALSYYLDPHIIFYLFAAILIGSIIYFWYLCAILNMAHNQGTIHSGLDLKMVYNRLKRVNIKYLLLVYVLTVLITYLLASAIFTEYELIPFDIYMWNVGDLILQLLLAPYLLIFSFRILGLMESREKINKTKI